ncbi:hypothetical protein CKA32_000485 [Geitlerinema sp. FC II]|nr:hypothetical protein [Geitlerinema sp. CS-897]PPT10036.1 hypothetical protein CKA32_000485 [Geitlerinema sp. FC II]
MRSETGNVPPLRLSRPDGNETAVGTPLTHAVLGQTPDRPRPY